MKYRPLHNQLLVRRAAAENMSKGGLHLPDSAQKKPGKGEVLAAGPGYYTDAGVFVPNTVTPGMVVLFAEGFGVDVEIDGEKLLILSEDAVMCEVLP